MKHLKKFNEMKSSIIKENISDEDIINYFKNAKPGDMVLCFKDYHNLYHKDNKYEIYNIDYDNNKITINNHKISLNKKAILGWKTFLNYFQITQKEDEYFHKR